MAWLIFRPHAYVSNVPFPDYTFTPVPGASVGAGDIVQGGCHGADCRAPLRLLAKQAPSLLHPTPHPLPTTALCTGGQVGIWRAPVDLSWPGLTVKHQ